MPTGTTATGRGKVGAGGGIWADRVIAASTATRVAAHGEDVLFVFILILREGETGSAGRARAVSCLFTPPTNFAGPSSQLPRVRKL